MLKSDYRGVHDNDSTNHKESKNIYWFCYAFFYVKILVTHSRILYKH